MKKTILSLHDARVLAYQLTILDVQYNQSKEFTAKGWMVTIECEVVPDDLIHWFV